MGDGDSADGVLCKDEFTSAYGVCKADCSNLYILSRIDQNRLTD